MKSYRIQFTLGSAAKLTEAVLELYLPILMARIIDVGIPTADRDYVIKTGLWLLLFAFAGLCCATVCQYFAAVTSQGTGTNIRNALMDKIASLSYRELDRFGPSTLINRLSSDVGYVQQMVAMTMRLVTRAPFICIGAVVMSIGIDRGLSLVFAAMIPLLGLIVFLLMRITSPLYRRVQQRLDTFARVVRENLSGVRVIRAFARTGQERNRADSAADELSDAYIHVAGLSALMNPATSIVLNAGIIVVLYLGASKVFAGRLSQGDLLAMTTYATKILYALLVIANLVVLVTKASASSARIVEVLETEPSVTDTAAAPPEPIPVAPLVEFQDVSFAYSGGDNALEHISFRLPRGKTLGIVGVTGSGKSTLTSLIQRFYDPDFGRVFFEGIAAWDWLQSALRGRIGVVPQNGTLFSGTIADNIRWGKEDASDEEVVAALKTAQCWDFVSGLPDGINTLIHEGGKNFSGGQKQRLTIARALVRRPLLLILDDSLSALDYRTDLNLRRALAADLRETTVIIVSQRISSVVSADAILVLDDGKQAGLGNHEYLLRTCKAYSEIYFSQAEAPKEGIDLANKTRQSAPPLDRHRGS